LGVSVTGIERSASKKAATLLRASSSPVRTAFPLPLFGSTRMTRPSERRRGCAAMVSSETRTVSSFEPSSTTMTSPPRLLVEIREDFAQRLRDARRLVVSGDDDGER
jgi:hypothetical protein